MRSRQATGIKPALPRVSPDLMHGRERFDRARQRSRGVANLRPRRALGPRVDGVSRMSVEITTLPSGLRIVTDAHAAAWRPPRSASGSASARAMRPSASTALSHLLEHMAFKGTRRRSARAIAEEIEAAGGDLNAATSTEQTAYYARVLADDTDLALDILADILQQLDVRSATSSNARKASSCRRSARSRTRPTISSSTCSARPPTPTSRSAGAILGTAERVASLRSAVDPFLSRTPLRRRDDHRLRRRRRRSRQDRR